MDKRSKRRKHRDNPYTLKSIKEKKYIKYYLVMVKVKNKKLI